MNEITLRVNKTIPAQVDFNYDEISKQLDEVLNKYTGLIFTEETVSDCKKTLADLRKGQKSLDEFRKKTKKVLTASVTEFENQCKELSKKFDEVINPITDQAEQFEIKRCEQKEKEITDIINTLAAERVLESKYAQELVITDQMLNKGTTIKSIKEDLTKQADLLLSQQNMERSNIELIKSKVELANAQYNVTLPVSIYLRQLEYSEVTEIAKLITEDAEKAKIKAEEAEAEKLAIEARKAERQAKLEEERIAADERLARIRAQAQYESQMPGGAEYEAKAKEEEEAKTVVQAPVKSIETEMFVDTYEIEGTEAELNALEDYLNAAGLKWSIKE